MCYRQGHLVTAGRYVTPGKSLPGRLPDRHGIARDNKLVDLTEVGAEHFNWWMAKAVLKRQGLPLQYEGAVRLKPVIGRWARRFHADCVHYPSTQRPLAVKTACETDLRA